MLNTQFAFVNKISSRSRDTREGGKKSYYRREFDFWEVSLRGRKRSPAIWKETPESAFSLLLFSSPFSTVYFKPFDTSTATAFSRPWPHHHPLLLLKGPLSYRTLLSTSRSTKFFYFFSSLSRARIVSGSKVWFLARRSVIRELEERSSFYKESERYLVDS